MRDQFQLALEVLLSNKAPSPSRKLSSDAQSTKVPQSSWLKSLMGSSSTSFSLVGFVQYALPGTCGICESARCVLLRTSMLIYFYLIN